MFTWTIYDYMYHNILVFMKNLDWEGTHVPGAPSLYPAMITERLLVHWLVSRKYPSLQVAQSVEAEPVQVKHDVSQAGTVTQNVKNRLEWT